MKKLKDFICGILFLCTFFTFINSFLQSDSLNPVWSTGTDIQRKVRAGNTATYSNDNNSYLLIVSGFMLINYNA